MLEAGQRRDCGCYHPLILRLFNSIMVERYLTYSAAKKQSREFAPRVAQALKNDRIEEAINISDKHRKSHLAMVVSSGLQEFRAHGQSSDISGDEIEASKRALQRAIAIKTAEFKRGLSVWRPSVRRSVRGLLGRCFNDHAFVMKS